MARTFRKLESEQDFKEFGRISVAAYPGIGMTADAMAQRLTDVATRDEMTDFIGCFEGDELLGGMRLIDYTMSYLGSPILAGGVGGVAVDLIHKKKGVAKDLINFYLDRYEQKGSGLAFLYPFRPDFYYRMGFGYGTKMNQYNFAPASLPSRPFQGELFYMGSDDLPLLRDFYTDYTNRKHGYCLKSSFEYDSMLRNHGPARTMIGYKENGRLKGYLTFGFRKAHENNFVMNNMVVREWLWDGQDALHGLCHFLHTQADQVNRIIFSTQDSDFHWLLKDVRNDTGNIIPSVYHEANTSGVGVMYRIISLPLFARAIAERNFSGITTGITLRLEDTFRPQNAGEYYLHFENGRLSLADEPTGDVTLDINMADLSALLMGSVEFATLYRLGRATTDSAQLDLLQRLFFTEKPHCISAF